MNFDTLLWRFGGFSTLGLVLLGAKYGHTGTLDDDSMRLFNKAQVYHLLANAAILALSTHKPTTKPIMKKVAFGGILGGMALFCIPLYAMAVNGRSEEMKILMPIGGVSLIAGCVAMALA